MGTTCSDAILSTTSCELRTAISFTLQVRHHCAVKSKKTVLPDLRSLSSSSISNCCHGIGEFVSVGLARALAELSQVTTCSRQALLPIKTCAAISAIATPIDLTMRRRLFDCLRSP